MKKIFLIGLILASLQLTAQEKREHHERKQKMERAERMSDYTPEEMAQLQTKQMTLDLDLTEAQQNQIMAINLKNAKARKAMMEARKERMDKEDVKEISKEERLQMKNDMLDRKIEMKRQMKEILNEDQYKKWEAMAKEKMDKGRHQKKQMMRKK